MDATDDRRHVVLAVALELDVAQHDQLVVTADFLEGARKVFVGIQAVATEPVRVRLGDTLGGVDQAFAGGVLTGPGEQGADGRFGLFARGFAGVGHRADLVWGSNMLLQAAVPAQARNGSGRHEKGTAGAVPSIKRDRRTQRPSRSASPGIARSMWCQPSRTACLASFHSSCELDCARVWSQLRCRSVSTSSKRLPRYWP